MIRIKYFSVILFFLVSYGIFAQDVIQEMEFINQPIDEILLILGEHFNKSIIPDETIKGNATYYFSETDFETALNVFLNTYKMYYRKEGEVYYISRINIGYNPASGGVTLDAVEVDITLLLNSISKAIGKTVLYDPLATQSITIHQSDEITPEKLLTIILNRYPDYSLITDEDYFYLKREESQSTQYGNNTSIPGITGISKNGDLYTINVENIRFSELIAAFFEKSGYEYSVFSEHDSVISRFRFQEKTFETMLRLILEHGSADYSVLNEIYYIFDIQQGNTINKLRTTMNIQLIYVNVRELPNLLPSDLLSSRLYKLDAVNNSIILNGSLQEIAPIEKFIKLIDVPTQGKQYFRFDLDYLDAANVKNYFPQEFKYEEPIIIPDTNSFILSLHPNRKQILEKYLEQIDITEGVEPVELKFIKADELLENLPPSITSDDIVKTYNDSIVFVKGTDQMLETFRQHLKIIDRPKPQIRYQILILQHNDSEDFGWNNPTGDETDPTYSLSPGDDSYIAGNFGNLLSLNFDAVSILGYQYAVKLSADLTTKNAQIMADTTLVSISGEEASFNNTEDYYYETTKSETGETGDETIITETKTVTTGLVVNINGWVSGDEMITIDVSAEISNRGTGEDLTTSENSINSQVRTYSGKPIVIGGMLKQSESITESKIPFLGDIPFLGMLFKSQNKSVTNSEIIIYIIPHVEYDYDEEVIEEIELARLYNKFKISD